MELRDFQAQPILVTKWKIIFHLFLFFMIKYIYYFIKVKKRRT